MTSKDLYKIFLQNPQVSTDSRNITPGCLFFALRGESFDGNQYAWQAIEKGARVAVIDNEDYAGPEGCILVPDSLTALQDLAREHRSNLRIPIIGLTGTNGKTTTKELITSVLSQVFKVHSTRGNLNNHIGVPLTILSAPSTAEVLVVEMGANHPGEIDFLSRIARPGIGLITNVGKAHLEGFGSFEGVKKTKGELFRYIREAGGTWIRNAADADLQEISGNYASLTYSTSGPADVTGSLIPGGFLVNARLEFPGHESIDIQTKLAGSYNLNNLLAAAAVGWHFGLNPLSIQRGLESYSPSNMRSQWTRTAQNDILLDAYNANPSSMALAIRNFNDLALKNKVLILGDMFELGNESEIEHSRIFQLVESLKFDEVYLAGEWFGRVAGKSRYSVFPDTTSLIEFLKNHPIQNRTILIKGSRGMKLEQAMDYL